MMQSPNSIFSAPAYSNNNEKSKDKKKHLTRTLLVSNIPETEDNKRTLNHLFNLFCCYGNVQRIKILYKNRSNALIQFVDPEYAKVAKNELNNIPFFG